MPSDREHSTQSSTRSPAPLCAACLSFDAGADIRANAERIEQGIIEAAQQGARLLLTPEAALTGYPGAGRVDLDGVDWMAVTALEDHLAELALERNLCLILGTGSPAAGGAVTNDALVCGALDHERRYRKRCLTPTDQDHYVAGNEPVVVPVHGWRIGLAICFDLRFPDVWSDLALLRADLFCCIAHFAGKDVESGVKARVIPGHLSSRAAELATPLYLCNTAASDRWVDSCLYDPRGLRVSAFGEGLSTCLIRPRQAYHDWYTGIRVQALARWRERREPFDG